MFFDFTVNIRCKGNDFCLTAKYFQYIFAQNTAHPINPGDNSFVL